MRATPIPATLVLLTLLAGSAGLDVGVIASGAEYTLVAEPQGWRIPGSDLANPPLVGRTGETIRIVVRWSEAVHNFAVYPSDVPDRQVTPGNPDALVRSEPVAGSSRIATITFTIRAAGRYAYYSEFRPATMAGLLLVEGPSAPNGPPTLGPLVATSAAAIPGQDVAFEAVATDPDGDPLAVRWEFGDGSTETGRTPPGGREIRSGHRFARPGTYDILVTVEDTYGGMAHATTTAQVSDPALLRVTTDPAVSSMISVDGISRTEWGLSWMKIEPGDHTVSFSDVPGYGTPPASAVRTTPGDASEVVGSFTRLGFLRVITDPPVPATISVDGVPRDDWGMWVALLPATYTVTFGSVAGYLPPPPESVVVSAGGLTTVTGRYTFDGVSPGPLPATFGFLRVTTSPGVPTSISLDGVVRDAWGLWVKLTPGTYRLGVTDVPGFGTPPTGLVTVAPTQTTVVDLLFAVHGVLRVTSEPAVPSTIFVDGTPRDDWGLWRSIPAGTYEVTFGPVSGFLTPPSRTVTVAPGGSVHVRGPFAQAMAPDMNWPTALAFADDGRVFIAERFTGAIRILKDGNLVPDPLVVLPNTATGGEQGLLGLALHPDFPGTPWLYAYQTFVGSSSVYNRVVRIRIDGEMGGPPEPVFSPIPASTVHNGGVIAFGPDGMLYVLVGDAQQMNAAQDPGTLNGKVLRMTPNGTAPPDNPFVGQPGANAFVYTYGHRNMFGIAFQPATGAAYVTENGPADSDEVNLLEPGGNYGWPIVRGIANEPPYIDPIAVYTPTIAPTNAIVYAGTSFPEFHEDLVFADWNTGSVRRLDLVPPRYDVVAGESVVFSAPAGILDLELAADGTIWFTTADTVYRWGVPAPPVAPP